MKSTKELCFSMSVGVAELSSPSYPEACDADNQVSNALDRLSKQVHWSESERGPFGGIIPRDAKVLVKPNLVLHENHGPWGIDPLITHPSLIRATVEGALLAKPSEILVGDAPIQGCDFDRLLTVTGLDRWADDLRNLEPKFKGIRDFRRTTCIFVGGVRVPSENRQPEDRFVLFDLGRKSLLEPVTNETDSFRVTCYDPRLMAKTHSPGRHQYLVARDIIDADVVINLPKLKTHKKAGITCALKNLIGINGNKEYLPHHRIGGAELGGDCYPGRSRIKRTLEYALDQQNMTSSLAMGKVWHQMALQLNRISRLIGDHYSYEGSWSGNDTIWRTCLDLNRILLYGRSDGSVADEPQRRVIHLVDAIIAGQGDGPLSPQPLPLGVILAGQNAAAIDWVGAQLLSYDPKRIPLVREAFGKFDWPLTSFTQNDVMMLGDWGTGPTSEVLGARGTTESVTHPIGWRDAATHRPPCKVSGHRDIYKIEP